MKLNQLFNTLRDCRASLIAALVLLGIGAANADNFFDNSISGVDLGKASGGTTNGHRNWAIFALSGGVTITDASATTFNDVIGNVGMANGGSLTLSNSRIDGTVYQDSGGLSNSGGTITGGAIIHDSSYLTAAFNSANSASGAAAGLATSTGGLMISGGVSPNVLTSTAASPSALTLNGVSGGITGASGQTYVLNISDLILSGVGAVLTLSGTATTNYVINVNRYMSLGSQASIALSGGLTSQNVLFNVKDNSLGAGGTGTNYDVILSGASGVAGIILAPNRNVKLTGGSLVTGEVIARGVSLSASSQVINPLASP
ncbi:MAG: hypothetical protein ABI318_00165 [Chthoniobacteraceae bacterium]